MWRPGGRSYSRAWPRAWVYRGNDRLITNADGPHVIGEAWKVKFEPKILADVGEKLDQVAKIAGASDDYDEGRRWAGEGQTAFGHPLTVARFAPGLASPKHHRLQLLRQPHINPFPDPGSGPLPVVAIKLIGRSKCRRQFRSFWSVCLKRSASPRFSV